MGPKKGKGGKKKGKKGGDEPTDEELTWILQAEIESLQIKLQRQMFESDKLRGKEMENRTRDVALTSIVKDEKQNTNDILCSLTS